MFADELTQFAMQMTRITEACNQYFKNQIPENAHGVIDLVRQTTQQFVISNDEHIKPIVDTLNELLHKPINHDTEAALINEVRKITDIVEPKNLVLTYKD